MEFDRITGLTDSMEKFCENWQNTWIQAILTVTNDEGLITDIYTDRVLIQLQMCHNVSCR